MTCAKQKQDHFEQMEAYNAFAKMCDTATMRDKEVNRLFTS
jgi:hypothetical protein